jgi:inosine/xanthosine triphosphatase
MRVVVGSGNPVKRDAAARVFDGATVEAVAVASGVSEQPVGHAETRRGAATRAMRALDEIGDDPMDAPDLGVGIEGGVAAVGDADGADGAGDGLSLVMWAAVTDGDRLSYGGGPTFPIPDHIAVRVRAGEELGPVMDDVLGVDDVARKQGAAGVFTAGRVTRTDALETAVAAAAGPFLSERYF